MDELVFDVMSSRSEAIINLGTAIEICDDDDVRPLLLKALEALVWSITPREMEGAAVLRLVKNEHTAD